MTDFNTLSRAELVELGRLIREAEAGAAEDERRADAEESAARFRATRRTILDRRGEKFRRWELALVAAESIITRKIAELSDEPKGELPGSAAASSRRTNLDSARRELDYIHNGAPAIGDGLRGNVRALGIAVDVDAPGHGLARTRAILAEIEQERAELEAAKAA